MLSPLRVVAISAQISSGAARYSEVTGTPPERNIKSNNCDLTAIPPKKIKQQSSPMLPVQQMSHKILKLHTTTNEEQGSRDSKKSEY